ncbi:MAG: DUF4162 domain-containing protein [Candidatus Aminicenantes bacterium]
MSRLKEVEYSLYEIKIKGDEKKFLQRLQTMKCKVNETEDRILKVYIPPEEDPQDIFRIADEENLQIRHFVKSQTSLEDLFAKAVGVD